jgi:N-acetylglucosamine-6-sulfatase
MDRRNVLRLLPALAGSTLFSPAAPVRPNIVFILVDDLRWDALSCAGHPFMPTPNIDRIAKEGARFRNAFVTTPLCSPSRASFLTGEYAHRHGILDNGENNTRSHQIITFPRLLQHAGYTTACIGKWHMGHNDDSPRPGFDRWVSFKGQGEYVDPVLNEDGKVAKVRGYTTDILADRAVEFIRRSHEKPFLLYLAHKAVHGLWTPAERHKGLFAGQPITHPPNTKDTLEGKPVLQRKIDARPPIGLATEVIEKLVRAQLGTLAAVDEGVGRLIETLEQTRQVDNTVVIFTSDNGYFWGEHRLVEKRPAYEESIRIPLLMRYPRLVKPGTLLDQLVLNVDLAPTLLEIGGLAAPKRVQGRSLLPLFRSRRPNWRRSFLAEYFLDQPPFTRIPSWQAVRTERWKYIHYTELEGMDEFYDLATDPGEMKNLINEPGSQARLKEMKAELGRLLTETE